MSNYASWLMVVGTAGTSVSLTALVLRTEPRDVPKTKLVVLMVMAICIWAIPTIWLMVRYPHEAAAFVLGMSSIAIIDSVSGRLVARARSKRS